MTISGKQVAAQGDRLAGQPFQRAVRADMDDGVDAERLAQPQAEGEQCMARRQGRVVIVGAAVGRPAAIRGERDGDVAEGGGAEGEGRASSPSALRGGSSRRLCRRRTSRPSRVGVASQRSTDRRSTGWSDPLSRPAGDGPAGGWRGRAINWPLPHAASTPPSLRPADSAKEQVIFQTQSRPAALDQIQQLARRFRNPFNGIALFFRSCSMASTLAGTSSPTAYPVRPAAPG